MIRTQREVWDACKHLTRVQKLLVAQDSDPETGDPGALARATDTLRLLTADALAYDAPSSLVPCGIVRIFEARLNEIALHLGKQISDKSPELSVYRLRVLDGRYVTIDNYDDEGVLCLRTWTWQRGPRNDLRSVVINLTTLLAVGWAGLPLYPDPETRDVTPPQGPDS